MTLIIKNQKDANDQSKRKTDEREMRDALRVARSCRSL